MKMREHNKSRAAWFMLLLLLVLLSEIAWSHKAIATSIEQTEDTVTMSGGQLTAQVQYGIQGYVKLGRYMNIDASILNRGAEFTGNLRVVYPLGNAGEMYQEEFTVDTGETRNVELIVPAQMQYNLFTVSLVDPQGQKLCESTITMNHLVDGTDTAYVGVLSGKSKQMGYLDGSNTRLFYLSTADISREANGLSALDVIVISDKNTKCLDLKQIHALKSWVKKGGTLVLGMDSKQKTKNVMNAMLRWKQTGDVRSIDTTFGMELDDLEQAKKEVIDQLEAEKIEKVRQFLVENLDEDVYDNWRQEISRLKNNRDILKKKGEIYESLSAQYADSVLQRLLNISVSTTEKEEALKGIGITVLNEEITPIRVKGAEVVLQEQDQSLMQIVSKGMGNVLIMQCSLAFHKKNWGVIGNTILKQITNHMSIEKKQQLMSEQLSRVDENYDVRSALGINEVEGLPNLWLYAVILGIYLVLIGPVLYAVLKRREKLQWLWAAIPALSIIFSVLIYLLGTSTRIKGPFVNYLAQLEIGEDGTSAQWDTYFRVQSPDNDAYEIPVRGSDEIQTMLTGDSVTGSYGRVTQAVLDGLDMGYHYGIQTQDDSSKLQISSQPAFYHADFMASKVASAPGIMANKLTYHDNRVYGNVSNQMDYDLEYVFLYYNGEIIKIGDIKKGQTINMGDVSNADYISMAKYEYDMDKIDQKLLDTEISLYRSSNGDVRQQRMMALINRYCTDASSGDCFLYGFIAEDDNLEDSVLRGIDVDKYGVGAVVQKVDMSYSLMGLPADQDITQYSNNYDGMITSGRQILDDSVSEISIRYVLPDEQQWSGLIYSLHNNPEFQYDYTGYLCESYFSGTVTALNQTTGNDDVLFQSSQVNTVENLDDYLLADGSLTLTYHFDYSSQDTMQLPELDTAILPISETKVPELQISWLGGERYDD